MQSYDTRCIRAFASLLPVRQLHLAQPKPSKSTIHNPADIPYIASIQSLHIIPWTTIASCMHDSIRCGCCTHWGTHV